MIEERYLVTLEADTTCHLCHIPLTAGTRVIVLWDEINGCWRHKCTRHRKSYVRERAAEVHLICAVIESE